MSYGGDPENIVEDAVRFELGDTKADNELVTDKEITYALGKESQHHTHLQWHLTLLKILKFLRSY